MQALRLTAPFAAPPPPPAVALLGGVPRNALGLLQTYSDFDVQTCSEFGLCHRHDVYDSALAAIYYLSVGETAAARAVLDGLLASGRQNGFFYASYSATGVANDWALDTGNTAWAGIAFAHAANGMWLVIEIRTLAHAAAALLTSWVRSFARAATANASYLAEASAILDAIRTHATCNERYAGYTARPFEASGRSAEHAIDVYSLASFLGDANAAQHARCARLVTALPRTVCATARQACVSVRPPALCARQATHPRFRAHSAVRRSTFVLAMYDDTIRTFHPGAGACGGARTENAALPVDVPAWGALAGAIPGDMVVAGLDTVLRYDAASATYASNTYHGYQFSTGGGSKPQWEATGGVALALGEHMPPNVRDSLDAILRRFGTVPCAESPRSTARPWRHGTAHDTEHAPPHTPPPQHATRTMRQHTRVVWWRVVAHAFRASLDTSAPSGFGWSYFRVSHVASTCWTSFALQDVNPFVSARTHYAPVVPSPYAWWQANWRTVAGVCAALLAALCCCYCCADGDRARTASLRWSSKRYSADDGGRTAHGATDGARWNSRL
jgi:hypothetical protein